MDQRSAGTQVTKANITVNADGWFQAVSPSFLELIGRPIESLAGLNMIDLVHPHDAAAARRLLAQLAPGNTVASIELRLFVAGDIWAPLQISARGVGDTRVILDLVRHSAGSSPPSLSSDPPAVQASPVTSAAPPATTQAHHRSAPTPTVAAPVDAHEAYVASLPRTDTPQKRAAARDRVGPGVVPMIEVDADGHTSFVSGPWDALVPGAAPGADVLETVLDATGTGDAVAHAMGNALDHGQESSIEALVPSVGQRWVHVLPIPSPHQAGVAHALIAINSKPHLAPHNLDDVAETIDPAPSVAARTEAPVAESTRIRQTTEPAAPTSVPGIVEPLRGTSAQEQGPAEAEAITTASAESSIGWREQLSAWLQPVTDWVERRDLSLPKLAAAAGVVLLALVLRVWDLEVLPTGFHGDEAITGQEAQRVLDQGSIGVYTGSALGQPTAPFYLHAIGVGLFGNTVWATRIIAALAGVLAVALTYLVVQKRFDHRIAIAAALAMATMTWTIHFSRIAFGVAWWPLAVLAAIAAIDRAVREMTGRAWFIAGGMATFGVYVYNSHSSFGLAVLAFMVVWLFKNRASLSFDTAKTLAWGPIGALVIGFPMLRYATDERNQFFNHFDLVSRRNSEEWQQAGLFGKVEFFVRRYIEAWDNLLVNPIGDGADAAGVIKQVPWIFTVLAIVGLIQVGRRYRTPFTGMLITTLVFLPIVPAMTFNAETRRDYGMAVCVAILAGIGAVVMLDLARDRFNVRNRYLPIGALAAIVLFTSVVPYFTTFRNSPSQKWVFAEELTATVDAVDQARSDGPVFVNWYSGRHYFDYPTLQFLLEDVRGVNRTPVDQGYVIEPPLELTPDIAEDQVYVFIGDYGNHLDALRSMYPDGQLVYEQPLPRVVVYEVPAAR